MKFSRAGFVALMLLTLAACGDKNLRKPAELQDISNPAIKLDTIWNASAGDGGDGVYSGLRLDLQPDALFAADADGEVYAFNPKNGDRIWRAKTKSRVISGPTVAGNAVYVGTLDADVIALKRADGSELWRAKLPSEVMAPVAGDGDIIVVRSVDGHVAGLSSVTGERQWLVDRSVPNLTLRGLSAPVVEGNRVFIGFDNGRVAALRLSDGQPIWEQVLSVPSGRTELERLIDIDAALMPVGGELYVVSFGGDLACIDSDSGQILWRRSVKSYTGMAMVGDLVVVTDESGVVWALDSHTGAAAWKQDALLYRRLSPPASFGGYAVVGDFKGYLHWLDPKDGKIVARSRVGSDPIRAAMVAGDDVLYVLGDGGRISAMRIKP